MDLKQIRYFVAVADAGSFSAGAKRAFVTQPTLSVAIAALEADLGFRLFERRARGVALTPRGELALQHARAVLRESEGLRTADAHPVVRKPLKLGLLPTLAPRLVATVLGRLQRLDAQRAWLTEDAALLRLKQRLAGGRYDAIFTNLGASEPGHRQIELAADAQALAVPRAARPRGAVTPVILMGQPLIVRVHCEQLQAASRLLDDHHVKPVVVARTDSDARALAMVAAGLGSCLIPDSFRHDGVTFVRPDGVDLRRRLGLEWIKGAAGGWFDQMTARL
jgi:DNA-binding transcriptional LysR family regulator